MYQVCLKPKKKKEETSYSAYHIGNKVNIAKEKCFQKKEE